MALSTPVAFFVFNRPRLTQRVFTQIAHARPSLLFVIADGPRASHSSDGENCQAVRRIVDYVDWPCRVFKHYSETNLGLVERITSGLNWIFEQVEECIILEDDCLPSASFFPFCAQLLERYQYDKQIMHINGYSYQFGRVTTADSYYFSRITCPWGWATWRRAWQYYDVRVRRWAELRETDWLQEIMPYPHTVGFFQRHFDRAYRGESKSWDSQWTFACLSQSALTISPRNDLIMNLGHGPDATQTKWGWRGIQPSSGGNGVSASPSGEHDTQPPCRGCLDPTHRRACSARRLTLGCSEALCLAAGACQVRCASTGAAALAACARP